VKTTVEIAEPLLARARNHARRTGRPLRALIEEGLRLVLQTERERIPYRLPDRSTGDPRPRTRRTRSSSPRSARTSTGPAPVAAPCVAHGVEALLTRDRDFSLFGELTAKTSFG
jgi:hypothetical protein